VEVAAAKGCCKEHTRAAQAVGRESYVEIVSAKK